jgi:GT2 family glycosyltransferase
MPERISFSDYSEQVSTVVIPVESTEQPVAEVVAVTVTYGDRADSCIATLNAAFSNGVSTIVVVDNGLQPASRARLHEYVKRTNSRARVISLRANVGSAGGFSEGLEYALAGSAEWIWLLDDDNLPNRACLSRALRMGCQQIENGNHLPAVSCVRKTDEKHMALVSGNAVSEVYLPKGTFFGFDLPSRLIRSSALGRVRHLARLSSTRQVDDSPPVVPQAPYGGLLLHRKTAEKNGPIAKDFILYFDDVEYSRRIVSNGGKIVFCQDAVIEDGGEKWAMANEGTYLAGMIRSKNLDKAYFQYRNCFITDSDQARGLRKKSRFYLNVVIYSIYVMIAAARMRQLIFIRTYFRALAHGKVRRLGFDGRQLE